MKSPDCTKCHNVNGFTPSQFTIEQHNQSAFQLDGGHLATPCFACHLKSERWEFREIGKACVDCHENIHQDIIEKRFYPDQNCLSCHAVSAWDLIQFDHHLTSFDLKGEHAQLSCRECHFKEQEDGAINQQFSILDDRCIQCHTDVHHNQFNEKGTNSCLLCHAFNNWDPIGFEHDSTRFKLDGGHADVNCIKCHKPITVDKKTFINYTFDDIKCALCHTP